MAKEIKQSDYTIKEGETVYKGAHSSIEKVDVSMGKHKVPLLRKRFIGYSIEFMDGPKWHSFLKKKGYPVFPTWRYDESERIDFITDLSRGGTHRVVDFCGNADNYEKIFVSNLSDLEGEVETLLLKLADDGIIINEPNIFFDVEISTGIAKVLLGDLREIGYEADYDGEAAPRDQILVHDRMIMDGHMSRLKNIMAADINIK